MDYSSNALSTDNAAAEKVATRLWPESCQLCLLRQGQILILDIPP